MTNATCQKRILIVDDDLSNVHFLQRLLAHDGYEDVSSAMSGADAILQALGQHPDLILLDLHMPGVNGFEVLGALRNSSGEGVYLPILVYSADITIDARKKALELGASDFLTKPGDAQEILLRAIIDLTNQV